MTSVKVASSDDLRLISEAARAGWLGRTLPDGAEDLLSDGAAHILTPVAQQACGGFGSSPYVRARVSVALKGQALPSECFVDVRKDYWDLLMDAAEALRLARLSTKWRPESPCAKAAALRSAA